MIVLTITAVLIFGALVLIIGQLADISHYLRAIAFPFLEADKNIKEWLDKEEL